MTKHKSRTRLLVGSGAAACVLLASSSAYACTTYLGRMEVTVTPGTGLSQAVGGNGDHFYCAKPEGLIATAKPVPGTATIATVAILPGQCGATPSILPDGEYIITFRNNAGGPAPAYTGSYTSVVQSSWKQAGDIRARSCGPNQDIEANKDTFFRLHAEGETDTKMIVRAGTGEVRVKLPDTLSLSTVGPLGPTDAAAICINPAGSLTGLVGNQVPLAVM